MVRTENNGKEDERSKDGSVVGRVSRLGRKEGKKEKGGRKEREEKKKKNSKDIMVIKK